MHQYKENVKKWIVISDFMTVTKYLKHIAGGVWTLEESENAKLSQHLRHR